MIFQGRFLKPNSSSGAAVVMRCCTKLTGTCPGTLQALVRLQQAKIRNFYTNPVCKVQVPISVSVARSDRWDTLLPLPLSCPHQPDSFLVYRYGLACINVSCDLSHRHTARHHSPAIQVRSSTAIMLSTTRLTYPTGYNMAKYRYCRVRFSPVEEQLWKEVHRKSFLFPHST